MLEKSKNAGYRIFSGTKWIFYAICFLTTIGLCGYIRHDFVVSKDTLITQQRPSVYDTFARGKNETVESELRKPSGAVVSQQKMKSSQTALQQSDKTSPFTGQDLSLKNDTPSTIEMLGSVLEANESVKSFNFIYSESAIQQYANAIHVRAQKVVDIGHGPCIQRLPKCIILGNFKCGTRELIDFMSMHPRIKILSKPMYELPFFTYRYDKGLEWYRRKMPCSYSNQITVVKTPTYFQSLEAPGRIHAMNSSVRLIVLIREPVSRTISHFTFHENRAHTFNSNLTKAILNPQTGDVKKASFFVKHSIYDEGMERYLHYFNRSQIKIIESNDFKRDPYTVLHELEDFLKLEHTIQRANIVFNQEKGFHCLREDIASYQAACYESTRGRNYTNILSSIKEVSEVSDKLTSFFKSHNDNFFKLLGREYDWYQ